MIATEKDIPRILGMMGEFHAKGHLPYALDKTDCRATIGQLMKHGFVAVSGNGFICGVVTQSPLNSNWIIAKEFLWWSQDGSGLALLQEFKDWANDQNADEIQMSCPASETRVRRFFSRRADEIETVFSEVA